MRRKTARDFTQYDDVQMMGWHKLGKSYEDIARRLNRTGSAIRCRIMLLGDRQSNRDKDKEIRRCLGTGCGKPMDSEWIGNRLCGSCSRAVAEIAARSAVEV